MKIQPISYSSISLIDAQTNTTDSLIKTKLDSWYKTNLVDYTSYLADETFCSDRSIISGSGYLTAPPTAYGAYNRLQNNKSPSLKCSGDNDKFKVSSTSAKLDYPIGLILADEVALAGGRTYYNGDYSPNSNYYLYNGKNFSTFTPAHFDRNRMEARVLTVMSIGGINPWYGVTSLAGIRLVISIKKDVTISKGDGQLTESICIIR